MAQYTANEAVQILIEGGACHTDEDAMAMIQEWYTVHYPDVRADKFKLSSGVRKELMQAMRNKVASNQSETESSTNASTNLVEGTSAAEADTDAGTVEPAEDLATGGEASADSEDGLGNEGIDEVLPLEGPVTRDEIIATRELLIPFIETARESQDDDDIATLANEIYALGLYLRVPVAKLLELGDDPDRELTLEDLAKNRVKYKNCWFYRQGFRFSREENLQGFFNTWCWNGQSDVFYGRRSGSKSSSTPRDTGYVLPTSPQSRPASTTAPAVARKSTSKKPSLLSRAGEAVKAASGRPTSSTPTTAPAAPVTATVDTTPTGNRRVSTVAMRPPAASAAPTQKSTPEPPSQTETSKDATGVWASRWAGPSQEKLDQIAELAAEVSADLSIPMDTLMGANR